MSKFSYRTMKQLQIKRAAMRFAAAKPPTTHIAVVTVAIATSLAACSNQPNQTDNDDQTFREVIEKDWEKLADGSRIFHSVKQGAHSGAVDVERCWPKDGRWDCFGAFQLIGVTEIEQSETSDIPVEMTFGTEANGPSFSAARAFKTRLNDPFPHSDEDNPNGGYRCYTMGGGFLNETIFTGSGEGTTLLSNDAAPLHPYGGYPWSEEFVTTFMRDNNVVTDRPYWNCFHIERLIASGSLATLLTTALTYEEMIGPASAEAR